MQKTVALDYFWRRSLPNFKFNCIVLRTCLRMPMHRNWSRVLSTHFHLEMAEGWNSTKEKKSKDIFIIQLCKNDVNLKHCIGQKFNVNVIKAAHRRSNFLKTLVSQEILASIGLTWIFCKDSREASSRFHIGSNFIVYLVFKYKMRHV